ncbi:hypothetical protein NPIL_507341 [Nephila pilipes]|uniref:Uncharacterized protein n=1 Tax=Nephila pilipes TaxID=299642 RepID=A0A8X6IQD4_NEPPI|nr:hypothetical protein NPIL_507341 [Nephila pilipes]
MGCYKLSSDKLSSVSRSCSSNTTKSPIIKINISLIIPNDKLRSQPHKYESFGQNKNQGAKEISGPTSHYDDLIYDDLVGQNNKHIATSELKENKEQL